MTGEQYVFRVRAVNAAGLSQFSQESEPVKVKAAIGESITVGEADAQMDKWHRLLFIHMQTLKETSIKETLSNV